MNLMKFNKVKLQVLHLDHSNPQHTNRLGRGVMGEQPWEKDLGVMVNGKLTMSWPETNHALG